MTQNKTQSLQRSARGVIVNEYGFEVDVTSINQTVKHNLTRIFLYNIRFK